MVEVDLKYTVDENFGRYAGMVIQKRALVDARDCLKPSARQLLYAQFLDKITHDKPYKKSTKSVSAGMSHFYVHGDTSAYSTLIRMGKPFSSRYLLEDVQGSFGNLIKSGNEAAMRYTEMRLSPLAAQLFESINKNTIDTWYNNYDDTEQYPAVLPSIGYYNIVQGTQGIGVALASSIPQFNLVEVNNALIKLLWNEDIDFDEIYCQPDFATGGVIVNEAEVKESLKHGTGKAIKLRGRIDYNAKNHQLLVTEFPYGVFSETICKQLEAAIEEDPNCGIDKFIDLTGSDPLIKITLNKKANPEKVRQWLFSNTSLQYHVGVNMVMLENGTSPKIFGWKEALNAYLTHAKEVLRKECEFDRTKAKNRLHILEGYLKALSIIDEVVATIRASANSGAATLALMEKFEFTELQAKAILDLKLQRLVNLEIVKLEKEKDTTIATIERLTYILENQSALYKEIENRLKDVAKRFGDSRRTVVLNIATEDSDEPIIEKNLVVTITKNGLIYPLEIDQFTTQNRGGKGLKLKLQPNDYILDTVYGSNNDLVMLFSNEGRAYTLKLSDVPVGVETYVNTFFDLKANEYITSIIPYSKLNDYKYVVFATKQGMVKKTKLSEYQAKRKTGLQGIKLKDDDHVVGIDFITSDSDNVILVTKRGYTLTFNQENIPLGGRVTMGVKGIKLGANDELVSINCYNTIDNPIGLATVTKNGLTKCTPLDEFSVTNRALKGVICQKFKTDDDYITAAIVPGPNSKEILGISSSCIIRIKVSDLQKSKRDTIGTMLMKVKAEDAVTQIIALD